MGEVSLGDVEKLIEYCRQMRISQFSYGGLSFTFSPDAFMSEEDRRVMDKISSRSVLDENDLLYAST